ncbi:MAG: hypothetical protein JW888_14760 [Pirellulales bacterium]|nr:hypothetical protein [Pirellulales bacterium]
MTHRTSLHLHMAAGLILVQVVSVGNAKAEIGPSDYPVVEAILVNSKANVERIVTWEGKVEAIAETGKMGKNGHLVPSSCQKNRVTFICDLKNRSWLCKFTLTDQGDAHNPNGLWSQNSLSHQGAYYDYLDVHEDQRDYSHVRIHSRPGPRGIGKTHLVYFHPVAWMFPSPLGVHQSFEYLVSATKDGKTVKHETLTVSGDLVTLGKRSEGPWNTLTFDMSKSAMIVKYRAGTGGRLRTSCDVDWVLISDVWVPKKIVRVTPANAEETERLTLLWSDQKVNQPLAPDAFSLISLGVYRGTTVEDERTNTSYVLTGSEYPVRPSRQGDLARTSHLVLYRWLCIGIASILALTICFRWYVGARNAKP